MKVIGRLKTVDFDGVEQLCVGTITKKRVSEIPNLYSADKQELWYFEPNYYSPYNWIHNFNKGMWAVCIWDEAGLIRFVKKIIKE